MLYNERFRLQLQLLVSCFRFVDVYSMRMQSPKIIPQREPSSFSSDELQTGADGVKLVARIEVLGNNPILPITIGGADGFGSNNQHRRRREILEGK